MQLDEFICAYGKIFLVFYCNMKLFTNENGGKIEFQDIEKNYNILKKKQKMPNFSKINIFLNSTVIYNQKVYY